MVTFFCYFIHAVGYFLTQYNGKLLQIQNKFLMGNEFRLFISSLLRRQSQHCNDNLILDIPDCRVTHQSFSSLVQLLSTHPIVELHIRGIEFQSTSDMDSPGDYPNSNVTSTHLSDIYTATIPDIHQ